MGDFAKLNYLFIWHDVVCHSESDGSGDQGGVEYDHQYDESQRGV